MENLEKKCFIIGNSRSGSTQIAKIISSHPFLKNKYVAEEILKFCKNNKTKSNLKAKIINLIKENKVIKEIIVDSKNDTLLEEYLKFSRNFFFSKNNFCVVRTFRKNKLKQAISSELALQTNCWHKSEKNYESFLKNIAAIPLENILKRIKSLIKREELLDEELKNKNYIKVEYEKFYFGESIYQKNIIKKIYDNMKISFTLNKNMLLLINNGKLNSAETYKMIPNVAEIEEELGSEENGFLFKKDF